MTEPSLNSPGDGIDRLDTLLSRMGGMVEDAVKSSIAALMRRDSGLAERVIAADLRIDAASHAIETLCIEILALRQPVASDLRVVVASLRIASNLGRMGDCAKNVARRTIALNQAPVVRPVSSIPHLGRLVERMLKDVLDAYFKRDADKALAAWWRDEEVDGVYHSLFQELLAYMMQDPRSITLCTDVLFIAKNLERVGDHATNIGEAVYFVVHGVPVSEARPKGDAVGPLRPPPERAAETIPVSSQHRA